MSNTVEDTMGPPHAHHMDVPTAYAAAKFGMWLFLATEVLLFGGLFVSFALFRWTYLREFKHASDQLNVWLGGLNTLVLLFSSLLAAMAVGAAQRGENQKVTKYLWCTIACGLVFLVVKIIEYSGKYQHEIFPGTAYFNSAEFSKAYKCFFGLYYCMTGLHALHVIVGMGILFWVASLSKKGRFSGAYFTPVEVGALYWHLVDLIWIYLFPLLYLVG